nr:hypothetical protein CFP56_17469 [Quercus suber]
MGFLPSSTRNFGALSSRKFSTPRMLSSIQIIIKVAAHRNRRSRRSGYAYEARDIEGRVIFTGGASKGRQIPHITLLEVVSEAIYRAKNLGFSEVIILSNSRRLVQICNKA